MTRVREARPADSAAWAAMRRALWPDGADDHLREVEEFFAGRRSALLHALIALDDSEDPVGFAELSIRPYAEGCVSDRVAYLEGWYVVPAARRKGVGRALLRAAEEWAGAQGCSEFASDALLENEESAAAHAAAGFVETARIRCFRKPLGAGGESRD